MFVRQLHSISKYRNSVVGQFGSLDEEKNLLLFNVEPDFLGFDKRKVLRAKQRGYSTIVEYSL